MPVLLCLVLLVLAGSAPRAQQTTIPAGVRAAAEKITADALARDLNYFASDPLQGRNTPSPGFDLAPAHRQDHPLHCAAVPVDASRLIQ